MTPRQPVAATPRRPRRAAAWRLALAAAAAMPPAAFAASSASPASPAASASSALSSSSASTAAKPATALPASAPSDVGLAEIEALVQRAVKSLRTDPATLFQLTEQALALLEQWPDADLEARVRVLRCDYYNERDRRAAERELERLRALAPKLRNAGHRAAALGCEGELYEQAGDNTRAMALYEQAVGVAEGAGDSRRLAEVLYLRGYLRGALGEFAAGLADLKRALGLYEGLHLAEEMRTVVNAVAALYNRMGALDEARRYYEEALKTIPAGASRERVVAQHNLGRTHERAGRWDDAQHEYEQVLAMARELRYVRGEVYALRGLAAVRSARGDGVRSLGLADEALRLQGQVPDEPLRGRLLLQRAIALRQLGRAAEGLGPLRDAIKIFAAGDAVIEEGEAREELAHAAADLGDWRAAYEEQERARRIMQALLRRQIDNRFASMKAQFDSDVRERELVMLQRENAAGERALAEQRRAATLQIVAAVLASALAALLGVLVWRQRVAGRLMRTLAMTDELTGLPNRRHALAALDDAVRARDGGALLIMDIDHFKRINDRHGHAIGDAVLRAVCDAWRREIASAGAGGVTLGRLGGEEFIAVLREGGLSEALALAERLRAAVSALEPAERAGVAAVTASVGVSPLAPDDTVAAALARADEALYLAKEGGRNRVEARS